MVRNRVGIKDFPFGMNPLRDYEAPPVPNRAAYLPIYCKTIRTRCNAIQTLLQLNSNNYKQCAFQNYSALAGFRGFSRVMAGLIASKFDETRPYLCGIDLQCCGSGTL